MKKSIIILSLLINSIVSFAQNEQYPDLFKTDSTWLKEIIPFPLGFAPELKYTGYEDLRFAKNWSKKDSPEFWSYVIAWKINLKKPLNSEELENHMQLYYNGLMGVVNKDKAIKIPNTTALFIKTEQHNYKGKLHVYDSFFSKTVITLYVQVEQYLSEIDNTYIPVFWVSSKAFDHVTWNKLKQVNLQNRH